MSEVDLESLSDEQLVDLFEGIAFRKGSAVEEGNVPLVNELTMKLLAIKGVLRKRGIPARLTLARLLSHADPAVRYEAARNLLAVDPHRARAVTEEVHAQGPSAIAGAAGMTLYYLDAGIVTPT
jgi:hypothetical protein